MPDDREDSMTVRKYRERLLADPYRPAYHFCVPDSDGRPGDPNGCFFAQGRHHLMYLYLRERKEYCWGHVSSTDLVHWRHHPDALCAGGKDDGCFSGGAFVDDDGTAYLTFWIYNRNKTDLGSDAGIAIASSQPPYDMWTRQSSVAIPSTAWGIREKNGVPLGCADPSNIWKSDGKYYMLTGNLCVLNQFGRTADSPRHLRGDWTELFVSEDLERWIYQGRFYQRAEDNRWTDETEDNMCPAIYPLPVLARGGQTSGEYIQLFISHNKGCQYYIGGLKQERFVPRLHGRMSWTDNAFFAPEAYLDGKGRLIMFAWLKDNLPDDFETYGWSGVQSLPRVLWRGGDGTLRLCAAPETDALAYDCRVLHGRQIHGETILPEADTQAGRIRLRMSGENMGVYIGSKDACVSVYYNHGESVLVMDASSGGLLGKRFIEQAPLALEDGEPLELTVYLDHAVVECFANQRQAISRRVYFPADSEAAVSVIGKGMLHWGEVSKMAPCMPY